jgi:hypothetical protein
MVNLKLPQRGTNTFLSTDAAAAFLGIAAATLTAWRCLRRGPRFRKHGNRVLYSLTDLVAWSDAQLVDPNSSSTAQCQTS